MPAVSILLPTYNGSQFLGEQLRSIVDQSFEEWELLIADDGSVDDTVAIAQAFAADDKRLTVFSTQGNLGQKRRLKQLVEAARSPLVAVADQDDRWAADKLEKLVVASADAAMAFGSSWLIDANGRDLGRTLLDGYEWSLNADYRLAYLIRPAVSAHGMIARRDLVSGAWLDRAQPFDWLLSLEAAFGSGLAYAADAKTFHRMHDNNQMNGHAINRRSLKLASVAEAKVQLTAVTERRYDFTARLEHLSFSNAVPLETATAMSRAQRICYDNWFSRKRVQQWSGREVLEQLSSVLRPFAASISDWSYTHASIQALTQHTFHPLRAINHVRRTINPASFDHSH